MPDMTGGAHEHREGRHSPLHSTDISYNTTATTMGSSLSTPSCSLTVPGLHAHANLVHQVATSSSSIREGNDSDSDSA